MLWVAFSCLSEQKQKLFLQARVLSCLAASEVGNRSQVVDSNLVRSPESYYSP